MGPRWFHWFNFTRDSGEGTLEFTVPETATKAVKGIFYLPGHAFLKLSTMSTKKSVDVSTGTLSNEISYGVQMVE